MIILDCQSKVYKDYNSKMRQIQSLRLGMGGLCFDIFSGFDSANGTLLGFGGFL